MKGEGVSDKISKSGMLTDVKLDGFHCRGRNGGFRGRRITLWAPKTTLTDPYGDVVLEVTSREPVSPPPIQVGMSWGDAQAVRDALNQVLAEKPNRIEGRQADGIPEGGLPQVPRRAPN